MTVPHTKEGSEKRFRLCNEDFELIKGCYPAASQNRHFSDTTRALVDKSQAHVSDIASCATHGSEQHRNTALWTFHYILELDTVALWHWLRIIPLNKSRHGPAIEPARLLKDISGWARGGKKRAMVIRHPAAGKS